MAIPLFFRSKALNEGLKALMFVLLILTSGPALGQVLWSDEFDSGTIPDSTVWSYDLGASGWGNQELQEYTNSPENARITDGNLVISALQKLVGSTPVGFTSARLRTENKLMFRYGTIEARIKIPDIKNGLWPAFWTLGSDFRQVGWPACGELDILEMGWRDAVKDGYANRWVSTTAHWEYQGGYANYGRTYSPQLIETTGLNNDYHIYSMNWTPDTLTTYLDGRELWTMNINIQNCIDCEELHQPHFIILNLAVGGTFTGLLDKDQITAPLPAEMKVDYLRIYDNGFTELSGSAISNEPPAIGPGHSGSWYWPDQDGHGFSMEFGELADGSPLAVIYWYTYDAQGNPIFMLGSGIPDGNRVAVEFVSPVGMVFGEFDPDSVSRENGGVGVFEFSDSDNASFSYTPSEFSSMTWGHSRIDALPLVKLFGIPAPGVFGGPQQR
jgi:beta-glucanase (GH16 family)